MRTASTIALAAGLIVLAAAGATLYARHQGQADLLEAAEQIRAGLGPGGSFTYAASAVHPLSASAGLTAVALREPSGELLTAEHVTLAGGNGRLSSLHATGVRLVMPSGETSNSASLDGSGITFPAALPGQPTHLDPATLTFTAMTLHDVAFSGIGTSAKLSSLDVGPYGLGRRSTVHAAGLSAPLVVAVGRADHVGFSSLTVSGLDLASILDAIEHHANIRQPASVSIRLELDGAYAARGRERIASADRLTVTTTSKDAGALGASNLALTGFSITPAKAISASLGLQRLSGNAASHASYRIAGGVIDIAPVTFELDGVGTLEAGINLAHVDAAALAHARDITASSVTLAQTQLVSFYARLADDGLLDRLLAVLSQRTGSIPARIRALAVARIEGDPSLAALQGGDQVSAALASFVADGGTLSVALHPPAPISLLALAQAARADPADLVPTLGMTVARSRDAVRPFR